LEINARANAGVFFVTGGWGRNFQVFRYVFAKYKSTQFLHRPVLFCLTHNSQMRLGILRVCFYAIHGGSSEFCDTMRINIFCPQKPVCVGFKIAFPKKTARWETSSSRWNFRFLARHFSQFRRMRRICISMHSIGKSSEILSFGRIWRSPRNCRLTAPKTPA